MIAKATYKPSKYTYAELRSQTNASLHRNDVMMKNIALSTAIPLGIGAFLVGVSALVFLAITAMIVVCSVVMGGVVLIPLVLNAKRIGDLTISWDKQSFSITGASQTLESLDDGFIATMTS